MNDGIKTKSSLAKAADRLYRKAVGKVINRFTSVTAQATGGKGDSFPISDEIKERCRRAGREGAVLLKNEKNALPVLEGETVSVFGRVQNDFFFVGYGSGGDVNAPYKSGFMKALRDAGVAVNEELAAEYERLCAKHPVDDGFWGHWPMSYDEFPLTADICKKEAEKSGKAIIILGRSSGEDRDQKAERGSYYLSKGEIELIDNVTAAFDRVILLLNCGEIIDMEEIAAYGDRISAIMYIWQCGMESGNAAADLISGRFSPCGKMSDTVAVNREAYPSSANFGDKNMNIYAEDIYVGYRYFETFAPEKVLWPFGYGLSYTQFEMSGAKLTCGNEIKAEITVTNTGKCAGKEVIQLYCEAPQGRLGKPSRVLVSFAKTKELAPGESETLELTAPREIFASYDEEQSAYILEKGEYIFHIGTSVRDTEICGSFTLESDEIIRQVTQCAAPVTAFSRLVNCGGRAEYRPAPLSRKNLKEHIEKNLPADDETLAGFTPDELEALSRGDYKMDSKLGAAGNAGAFGGVLKTLRDKGINPVTTTDGPSGIRLKATSSLLPIGVALASSFSPALTRALYECVSYEMAARGSDLLLAPGMNIHRDPLCGRNFEYFSEDPLLTGKMGAAVTGGIQNKAENKTFACPKHFACNNQEYSRTLQDSVVSERALREIYLRGFEICVKEAQPGCIMTSYNKVNGVYSHYHYEMVTDILRREWGYEGCVITDWWMRKGVSPEFPLIRDQAYRVRAGVNVLMPGGERAGKYSKKPDGTLLESLGKDGGITLAELRQNAKYVTAFAGRVSKK